VAESFCSGVLVSIDGYVLTTEHALNHGADKVEVFGAMASRYSIQEPLDVMDAEADKDLLLLKFRDGEAVRSYIGPGDPRLVRLNTDLLVMGFPGQENLAPRKVFLSNKSAEQGRWVVQVGGMKGDSGSPVLDSGGKLVAIYRGGYEGTDIGHAIPINQAYGILAQTLSLRDSASTTAKIELAQWKQTLIDAPSGSFRVESIPIDQEKDDHPNPISEHSREYTTTYTAPDGLSIVSASMIRVSDTRVSNLRTTVSEDRKSATLKYFLTSGPAVDKYRGWLRGRFEVVLTR
jgi:S1-C subfamily serine protease